MEEDDDNKRTLFIGNLEWAVTEEEMKKAFEKFGPVRSVHIPRDYTSKKPQGYGFVKFCDSRHTDSARRRMDGSNLKGRGITVLPAKGRPKSPEEMRQVKVTKESSWTDVSICALVTLSFVILMSMLRNCYTYWWNSYRPSLS
eukprot:Filipodium_phascolosomae@DN8473_c0_g1_i1.p1